MEGRPTDRLMGARSAVLPGAECRPTNGIGRATQARPGARIEVGVPHTVVRRTRVVTEIVEVGLPDSASAYR